MTALAPDHRSPGALHRVLNVNDNEAARYMLSRVLKQGGFTVIEASTGAEALERVRVERPAVVILDIRLPDLNGFEICRRIKTSAETEGTKVVYSTATPSALDSRIRRLEGGADGFLAQPFEPEQLVATVRSLLQPANGGR